VLVLVAAVKRCGHIPVYRAVRGDRRLAGLCVSDGGFGGAQHAVGFARGLFKTCGPLLGCGLGCTESGCIFFCLL
jgi:hypothetical protein